MNNYLVNQGYKQTEVGVITYDWEEVKINDISEKVGSGITPTGGSSRYKKEGRPFVRSQNVGWGRILYDDLAFIDEDTHSSFDATELVENDVLLNITGASIGRSAIANKNLVGGNVNQHVCIIRAKKEQALPKFINLFLLSSLGQKQIDSFQAGGNRQGLNFGQIKSIIVPLPPIAEQEKIAEVLSDVDGLIESLEEAIAKKRHIKQGMMQELLTGKRRLKGFEQNKDYKQTELGLIPEDWEIVKLGKYAEITKLAGFEYTNYFNSYEDKGEIIVIRGTNITQNRLDLSDIKTIPKETSDKLPRSQLKKNDLVFAYVGTIGPVFLIDQNNRYHLGPNTARITCNQELSPIFLFCYFCSQLIKSEINERISVGAQPSLSMTKIRDFKVIKPAKEEQEAIAQILTDMDEEITALEEKLEKTRQIKQGMMQELLTGRIRLTNNDKK